MEEAGTLAREKFAPLLEELWAQLELPTLLSAAGVPSVAHPVIKKSIVKAVEAALKQAVERRGSQLLSCENLFAFAMKMASLDMVASHIAASAEEALNSEFERGRLSVECLRRLLPNGPVQSSQSRFGLEGCECPDAAALHLALML